jgi:hypothetical protein
MAVRSNPEFGISFDADRLDGEQWIVTEYFAAGWSVVAKFASRAEAANYAWRRTGR